MCVLLHDTGTFVYVCTYICCIEPTLGITRVNSNKTEKAKVTAIIIIDTVNNTACISLKHSIVPSLNHT